MEGRWAIELLVGVLLVVTFFIGPLKLIGVGWLSYLLPDVLTVVILVLVFGERAVRRLPLFARSGVTIPILVVSSLCILQLANPEAPFIRSVLGLRTWALYLGFFFVGFYALRSSSQVERLYAVLLALGSVTAVYGVYQWRAGPESFANWSEAYGNYARIMWSGGSFRAFSTFLVPNTFAANMGLLMLVAFSVAASRWVRRPWRLAAGAAFAVMGAGIAASGTRAPVVELVLAAIIGVLVLRPATRRLRLGVTGIVLSAAAVLLVVTSIGTGISGRFMSMLDPGQYFWKWFDPLVDGLSIATSHPFGMGMGYTGGIPQFVNSPVIMELPSMVIDSGYGSAAAEMGFIGLGVFLYFVAKVGIEGVVAWRRLGLGKLQDLMLAPALIAALYPLLGVIGGTHTSLPSSVYTWLLIGMLIRAPMLRKESDADQVSASQVHSG